MKGYKLSQTKALPLIILAVLFLLFPHSSLSQSKLAGTIFLLFLSYNIVLFHFQLLKLKVLIDVEKYKERAHESLSYELQHMVRSLTSSVKSLSSLDIRFSLWFSFIDFASAIFARRIWWRSEKERVAWSAFRTKPH